MFGCGTMSEQENLRESGIKEFVVREMGLNPKYVKASQMWSSDEFWIKIPVGLTEKNLKSLTSRFKIMMIIPTRVEGIEGLDVQVREIRE